jgi:hypothetical protein
VSCSWRRITPGAGARAHVLGSSLCFANGAVATNSLSNSVASVGSVTGLPTAATNAAAAGVAPADQVSITSAENFRPSAASRFATLSLRKSAAPLSAGS